MDGLDLSITSSSQSISGYFAPWPLFPFIPLPSSVVESKCTDLQLTRFLIYFSIVDKYLIFSPMQVTLASNGSKIKPIGFISPPPDQFFQCISDVRDLSKDDVALAVGSNDGFWIYFAVQPGDHSTLLLTGLSHDGVPISIPDIHYETATAWKIGAAP